jgi:hypothetical protein
MGVRANVNGADTVERACHAFKDVLKVCRVAIVMGSVARVLTMSKQVKQKLLLTQVYAMAKKTKHAPAVFSLIAVTISNRLQPRMSLPRRLLMPPRMQLKQQLNN